MHADRTNRIALTFLGLVLLACGAGAMLASTGIISAALQHKILFNNTVSRYVGRNGPWLWAAAAVVCAALAVLAAIWLRALLLSTDRASELIGAGDRSLGTTVITPTAVTTALTNEISTIAASTPPKPASSATPTPPKWFSP